MVLEILQPGQMASGAGSVQYRCRANLNVYDSPGLERLATQAAIGRYLQIGRLPESPLPPTMAVEVCLCEDAYPGWIAVQDLEQLELAESVYQPVTMAEADIHARIPAAIAFTHDAMRQPNEYLWGGTVAPNYDCSGLIQAAFASTGVWLPRDAYQQEAFTPAIALTDLQPGDLIFFGTPEKATHVGLHLGDRHYIHSSGKDQGHNGIAIDVLSDQGTQISQTYYAQLRGAGRITSTYQPIPYRRD